MYHLIEELQNFKEQQFAFLKWREEGHTLVLTLNRPEKKNALHPILVNELAYALMYARETSSVRVVVLEAAGDTFCAGADLKVFAGGGDEVVSSVPAPQREPLMGELFNLLHKPSIARVQGNAYAGAFLLLAACTYVVAADHARFGLPEVKRGIFPFQVMVSLIEIMPARQGLDWGIKGYDLSAQDAQRHGLVTHVCNAEDLDKVITNLCEQIAQNSPNAIRLGLEAYDYIRRAGREHQGYMREMLMKALQHPDSQEGIAAFREKRAPNWQ